MRLSDYFRDQRGRYVRKTCGAIRHKIVNGRLLMWPCSRRPARKLKGEPFAMCAYCRAARRKR